MALTSSTIKTTYPLPSYNYRVQIDAASVAFSEVSGLTIKYETTTYKESPIEGSAPGPNTMHMPAQSSPPTITLKKGIVQAVSIKALYDWIALTTINQIQKKDITVQLCDEKGAAVIVWKIHNAFPTSLSAPTFTASSNDAAIESMELKADFITMSEP